MMDLPTNYDALSIQEKRLVREEYIKRQGGKCYFCGAPLNEPAPTKHSKIAGRTIHRRLFPESFFKYPVHLHHSHETGMTIGAVHNICNAILWQYYGE